MEKNIGNLDKVIRILLALVFAYMGLLYSVWWYILSIVLVITVFTGYCWPYKLLGINTAKKKAKKKRKAKKKEAEI